MLKFAEILRSHIPVTIVDVGAASMGAGTDAYDALLGDTSVSVIGFEPNAAACAALNAAAPANRRYFPNFVGDGMVRTFHHCANPLTSSLYEPNAPLLAWFQNMPIPVVRTEPVQTTRLDAIEPRIRCDFLKLDVQGAELDVLKGARGVLADALVVHTEVEFLPLYKEQALFGDVDVFLRAEGFMLHRFDRPFSRQFAPVVMNGDPFSPGSQILYAEAAVYIRALDRISTLSPSKILVLARIMHDVYRSIDLVCFLLNAHDRIAGSDFLAAYLSGMNAAPAA